MSHFQRVLKRWYHENKRDLPWRRTKDPYRIWLSEVILQQTRVDQGMDYYLKFIDRFPNISKLALAKEQEVLALWQGLGYYSRARNLHSTAKYIYHELKGAFPKTYNDLVSLKGVGPYTAAAISSFSYGEPRAVLDGNVYRVISRMYNIHIPINSTKGVREFTKTAQKILNKTDPGLHNQAMMEFGALVCLPKTPKCNVCPFHLECVSRREGKEKDLPVKSRKTKKRQRFFLYTVFVNLEKEILFLRKRTDNDIWRNLYDFHLQEFSSAESLEEKIAAYSSEFKITQRQHLLSHQTINACFIIEKTLHTKRGFKGMLPIDLNELSEYPLPALIKKYIDDDLVHLYSLIR